MLLNKGKNPFYKKGDSTNIVIQNINNHEIEFDSENCPISAIGRHLIYKLLDKNPSYRYSARLALNHPWITLNKFDKIPMTLYDKIIEDENVIKLNMLLFISSFMLYYKKHFLIVKNDKKNNYPKFKNFLSKSSNNEICKNSLNESMDNYEKNVLKSNKIYEEKFKENRENMFLPKCKTSKEVNKYLLKIQKSKFDNENKKNEDSDNNNNEKEINLEIFSDKDSENEIIDTEGKIINEIKKEKVSSKQFDSNSIRTQVPKKSILKKSSVNINPTNLKYNNNKNNQFLNEQGKSPDIHSHFKRYDQKLSSKLITFRLAIESKDIESKKSIMQKPIKLQSIKNSNEIMNKSKSYKLLNKNSDANNNRKEFDNIMTKTSKSTKNIERIRKDKKFSSTDKINRNSKNDIIKVSYSMDIKFNNKKKINYKPIKIKDEYDDKLNFNLLSTKSIITKKKLSGSHLTSIKKTKNNSVDKSQYIPPKRLFQNISILPPIQNK